MSENAFVALDFETANGKRTSICSVGMVKVIENQITESCISIKEKEGMQCGTYSGRDQGVAVHHADAPYLPD